PILEVALAPADMAGLAARLEALDRLAPARVRLTIRPGRLFGARAAAQLEAGLTAWLNRADPGLEVMNFWDEEEPIFLASSLALTADGELGWETGVRLGGIWPRLRQAVPVKSLRRLDRLFMDPAQRGRWAGRSLSGPERALWMDHVGMALRLRAFFSRPFPGRSDGSENRSVHQGLIAATLPEQDRFLRSRLPGLDAVFYFVRSGCVNDCVFCKNKPPAAGPALAEAAGFLRDNLEVGRRRIALVGNEPLLHPKLEGIVRLCRRYGFSEVEVMSSGTLLADKARARSLQKAGATAFAIPLYAARPAAHDALTGRAGSFAAAAQGIENLRSLGLRVHVHCNLMKPNLGELEALERLVLREWRLPFGVLPLRPKDPQGMNRPYRDLEPSYAELIRSGLRLRSWAGLPLCIQRRLGADGRALSGLAEGIKLYLLHQNFVRPVSCGRCPAREACLGVFREHLELHPGDLRLLALP
ncbi:MAG: radical SAM protein, partial [Elusimicrobia bacterium]|nr:radical SAM protein [Elusimicrobiota bacterium]